MSRTFLPIAGPRGGSEKTGLKKTQIESEVIPGPKNNQMPFPTQILFLFEVISTQMLSFRLILFLEDPPRVRSRSEQKHEPPPKKNITP